MVRILILILLIFASQVSLIQFGFLLKDEEGSSKNRFVAFGIIPETTSDKVKSEIIDACNNYIAEELINRKIQGIERESFISELIPLINLWDRSVLTTLKGELSVFLNIFRFSCLRIEPVQKTWDKARFFTDPIITLKFYESGTLNDKFEVTLLRAAFQEDKDSLYENYVRWDTVSSLNDFIEEHDYGEDEEITFHNLSDFFSNGYHQGNKKEMCCCNNCVIS